MIFHDRSLERIVGDSRGICDLTLAELQQLDVGSWKHEKFRNTRIPKLEDVFENTPGTTSFIVEIKPQYCDIEQDRELERRTLNILDDNYGINRGYISVREEETFQWFRNNTRKYRIGLMQKKRSPEEMLQLVNDLDLEISQIRIKSYNQEEITKLKNRNTEIMVYYADNSSDWDKLINWKVDGILTNYPSLLQGYLTAMNNNFQW